MMKAGVVLTVLLLSGVTLAAAEKEEESNTGAVMGLFTRKLKGDDPYDIVDCKPYEKDCPHGTYCVYAPDKKCKTEKECYPEKVQKCVKYSVYYETHDPYGEHKGDYKKEIKCAEYGYEEKEKCQDKEVCFEYFCAKIAKGYH